MYTAGGENKIKKNIYIKKYIFTILKCPTAQTPTSQY